MKTDLKTSSYVEKYLHCTKVRFFKLKLLKVNHRDIHTLDYRN